jgi:hypothetical protein
LSAASSYQDKNRGFFPRRGEMVNKFSFANRMSIYRVGALSLCRGD